MTGRTTFPDQAVGTRCQACDSDAEPQVVYRKWGYPIRRCLRCRLGSTAAGDLDVSAIYTSDYFNGARSDGYADYLATEAVLRREFRGVLRSLQSCGKRTGKLLEIGCAYGFFLEEARHMFDVAGIEACDDAVRFCVARGLDVTAGLVDSEVLRSRVPVDVFVMLDVIEHLPDPL